MPDFHEIPSPVLETSIQKVKAAVLQAFENDDVSIFLFGSRASGNAHSTSDIDIGILSSGCFDRKKVTIQPSFSNKAKINIL